ncbi:hypothetical protein ABBQ38_002451 [Trebouxia sp. C0009 RCD-2024]
MPQPQGRIFIEPTLPELTPQERSAAYRQLATTLAALHSVEPQAVNLQRYGRPSGYCARQVWRWSQQYQAQLTGQALLEMMQLIDWLKTHIPPDDSDPSSARISHGDYRIDNLIYAPDTTDRVLALLDWELSTMGYPLADLAYSAMCYHFPISDKTGVRGLPRPLPEGIPSEQEYIQMYCQARGIGVPDPTTYAFCQALSMFRIAAILAGVGARAQLGNASSKHAAQVGSPEVVSGIARQALSVIHEAAQATGSTESHGSSEAGSSRRGVEATRGGSPFTHPNGNSQGIVRQDVKADATTPAMPSMSGTNAASTYSHNKHHPNLTGRGTSSTPASSSTTPTTLDKDSRHGSSRHSGNQVESNTMGRGAAGGAAPNEQSANSQGSDNMGGGSSAIFSQGPKQESGGEGGSQTPSGGASQGDASTPAMPSMSGTGAATTYSDNAKKKSLNGISDSGVSSKNGISKNPTSSSSGRPSNPTSSNLGSDNMGGGSSAIYSQGPRQGGHKMGSEGDASTPAMPSMSGSNAASMYAARGDNRALSGKSASAGSQDSGGHAPAGGGGASGSSTDHFSGIPSDGGQSGSANLGFDPPPRVQKLVAHLKRFMEEHVYPSEHLLDSHAADPNTKWTVHPKMEELKAKARAEGLWNLWLPADMAAKIAHLRERVPQAERHLLIGPGLSNLEYAFLSEVMGRSGMGSEVFNCSAPDTGNMEVLSRYGSRAQQEEWLLPLLQGKMRSCFAMTEPQVASSDATNIQSSIRRDGDSYIVSGQKWWTSGAPDPRCKIAIFMGKTDPSAATHKQQSMILVPMDAPGVRVIRPLNVYGYDDAPHGHAEVSYQDVRVPAGNMLLGEGRGFEIAQGRLGPGRLHHCMRAVGMGERALELMGKRALQRVAFKTAIAQHGAFQSDYARCRIELSAARLTVLAAAHALDQHGNKKARGQIAAAKVYAPNVVLKVIDAAVQVHGGAGVCDDLPLARMWSGARTLRLADGPDDVHLVSIAKLELAKLSKL